MKPNYKTTIEEIEDRFVVFEKYNEFRKELDKLLLQVEKHGEEKARKEIVGKIFEKWVRSDKEYEFNKWLHELNYELLKQSQDTNI